MDLITDGLLVAGALFAGSYCWVLSRRVAALKDLDSGLGGAITQMTRALEEARRALEEAKTATRDGRQDLRELVTRAEAASGQLRILLAASRDIAPERRPAEPAVRVRPRVRAEAAEARADAAPPRAEPTPSRDAEVRAPDAGPALPEPRRGAETPPERPADAAAAEALALPKPRQIFPLEMLRPRPAAAASVPDGEGDILAELAALAGGRA